MSSCGKQQGLSSLQDTDSTSSSNNDRSSTTGIAITNVIINLDDDDLPDYSDFFEGKTVINYMSQVTNSWDYEYVWNEINKYLCDNDYDFIINYIPYDYTKNPLEVYENYCDSGVNIDIIDTGCGYYDEETNQSFNQTMYKFIEKGYLLKLNDMFETDEGKKLYNIFPEWYWKRMEYKDGNIYGKPDDNMSGFTSAVALSFNNQYIKKYNIDIDNFDFYDADEIFEKILSNEAVTPLRTTIKFHANPDEYGESNADFFARLAGFQLVEQTVAIKDNKAVNIFDQEETLNLLEKLREYKSKGYYEYYENSEGYSDGKFFAQLTGSDGVTRLHIYYSDYSYVDTDFKILSSVCMDKFYGNSGVGIAANSSNKDKAFKALSVLNTDPEIAHMLKYGIEGRNYFYYDEYSSIEGADKNINELYKSGKYPIINTAYVMSIDCTYNDDIVAISSISEKDDRISCISDIRKNSVYYPLCKVEIKGKELKKKAQEVRDIYDEYAGLWLGEYEDVPAALKEMNQKLTDAGIQDLIDYYNQYN